MFKIAEKLLKLQVEQYLVYVLAVFAVLGVGALAADLYLKWWDPANPLAYYARNIMGGLGVALGMLILLYRRVDRGAQR